MKCFHLKVCKLYVFGYWLSALESEAGSEISLTSWVKEQNTFHLKNKQISFKGFITAFDTLHFLDAIKHSFYDASTRGWKPQNCLIGVEMEMRSTDEIKTIRLVYLLFYGVLWFKRHGGRFVTVFGGFEKKN